MPGRRSRIPGSAALGSAALIVRTVTKSYWTVASSPPSTATR